jgi:hypothetical protein
VSVIYCTIAPGPCQSSHSWVEVPQNSRPYLTVSFDTLPTWWARSLYLYPPGTGWPSYTPGIGFPFCRLLRLAGLRWRYSNPPPHGSIVSEICISGVELRQYHFQTLTQTKEMPGALRQGRCIFANRICSFCN